MEINEQGQFIPTPMPKLYFDHDQDSFTMALGVTSKRKRELQRAVEDMRDEITDKKRKPFKRMSEEIEAILNLAENEQERMLLALTIGAKHADNLSSGGSSHKHQIDLGGGTISEMMAEARKRGIPDEITRMIIAAIKNHFGDKED